jgi:hypothetical protein
MKRIFWLIGSIVLICLLTPESLLAQETLDNAGVVALKQAGLGDTVIINKIKASKCDFDISTDGLKKLKEGGLSDDLINTIITTAAPSTVTALPKVVVPAVVSNDPSIAHEPGIWVYQEQGDEHRMVKLKPEPGGQSSGWNKKSRAVLYGAAANLQISGNYSFYYYEEAKQEGAFAAPPMTADDFALAKMEVRQDKNVRRLAVGKEGFFGGKSSGLDPAAYVPAKVEKISDGIFQIEPVKALQHGEYCFISKAQASREAIKHSDVELYDFGVTK